MQRQIACARSYASDEARLAQAHFAYDRGVLEGVGIFESHEVHSIGYFDCVSIAVWRRAVTLEGLAALAQNHALLAAKYDFVCTFVVAESAIELPSASVRAESARLMRSGSPKQRSSVSVIEGAGFVAAASRGVLTAIQVLSKHAYPLHTCAEIADGARWTAEQAARPVQWASALERAVSVVRNAKLAALTKTG